ncbi:MAG TPA: adenylate/guanylate cyclase domain-containing protein [Bradyrhizobium sp.]|nr:adenylate/guanylate cyclase domain-containing protein [Bradyrhizobium sp.]HET7884978.1 adenylate/guanylate cyclase domain-containing protein [Bradyrhizobium sp.]
MVHERPARLERRLAAILAADVAGYSRLMHAAEEATHMRLTVLMTNVVVPAIETHGGRIVKNTGDGLLAEFPSAVEATRAALQFQKKIDEISINEPEDQRILFRVGVNIGDVIVEPHDIFGDDVNVAARLESISTPSGICISAAAYDQISGKLAVEFDDIGEQFFKNIARPTRAYAWPRSGTEAGAYGFSVRGPVSPPYLSMVVLPFANFGDDPEQEYFADGVTESLTTDLSRIDGSFVIARNTAFTFKGKAVNVKHVGRELNVRYALEGSVQRGSKRLRINVQLIDTETGKHIWAERFEKPIADLYDMQDEIVARLAQALDAQLMMAEARRAERSRNPDAMELVFQGIACLYKGPTSEPLSQARRFFERALKIDSRNVGALVGLASVDATAGAFMLTDDRSRLLALAESNAIRALSLDPDRALAHRVLGTIYNMTNRHVQAIAECEQALTLDRNLADAHAVIGMAKYYLGRAGETEGHILEAFRLSPRDIYAHRWMQFMGVSKMQLGADAEAAVWLRRSVEGNRNSPLSHFLLAAALSLQGSLEEARLAAAAGLALNPGFTIRRFRASQPSDNKGFLDGRERLYRGMLLAGVPDE